MSAAVGATTSRRASREAADAAACDKQRARDVDASASMSLARAASRRWLGQDRRRKLAPGGLSRPRARSACGASVAVSAPSVDLHVRGSAQWRRGHRRVEQRPRAARRTASAVLGRQSGASAAGGAIGGRAVGAAEHDSVRGVGRGPARSPSRPPAVAADRCRLGHLGRRQAACTSGNSQTHRAAADAPTRPPTQAASSSARSALTVARSATTSAYSAAVRAARSLRRSRRRSRRQAGGLRCRPAMARTIRRTGVRTWEARPSRPLVSR